MERSPDSFRRHDDLDFNVREWNIKGRISRENTNSRRFSGSYIRSFRGEETRSFRSNITIASTASSPGYPLRDEIDPSTYSFTTALRALQARLGYNSWECSPPDGLALNSKWNEAEKYICNPLSGEVPMECLSAKTLSGRSFRNITNRITMSAPLVYSATHSRKVQAKPSLVTHDHGAQQFPLPEKKMEGYTRDVGTQSTPPDLSSGSPSPSSAPAITERSLQPFATYGCNSPDPTAKAKSNKEAEVAKAPEGEKTNADMEDVSKAREQIWRQGGCLSWIKKRQTEKHKARKKNFLPLLKGC